MAVLTKEQWHECSNFNHGGGAGAGATGGAAMPAAQLCSRPLALLPGTPLKILAL